MANAKAVRRQPSDESTASSVMCAVVQAEISASVRALFAVPNGGRRDGVTRCEVKAEGVIPGVADLIF